VRLVSKIDKFVVRL